MIERYKINQKLRLEGKVIGYPFYLTSPKLGQFIPSIPKGKCVHVTASTNVGKTMFWKWYFLVAPFLIYKLNPDSNFKPRFIIFLLEETFEKLYDGLISTFILLKFRRIVEPSKLEGLAEEIITDEELRLAEEVTPMVEELLSHCKVIDNVYNPTGLFKQSRSELLKHGLRTYTTLETSTKIITEKEYHSLSPDIKRLYKFHNYKQNDESEYWFIISDNVNLIETELQDNRMLSKHEAIWKWSTDYGLRQLQKNYNAIIIDIIQQAADTEKQQYTFSGSNITEKVKPSREGYANNKEIGRNADLILGLFAPTFYGITEYGKSLEHRGYNLNTIGDFFRTIIILKNRLGRGFKEIPLFFNGATNYFTELPVELSDKEELQIKEGLFQKNFKKIKAV